MSFKINILSNYFGTAFTVLCPMLALPYYLHSLGGAVWGLVCFAATIQGLLSLVDAGISQSLVTDFAKAKHSSPNSPRHLEKILFGFERFYWVLALSAGTSVLLLSPYIAKYWLELDGIAYKDAQLTIIGAAIFFIFQFPGSVYRSFLIGTEKQVLLNNILSISSVVRHFGGVIFIQNFPTLTAYLIWHGACILLETAVRGVFSWITVSSKRSELYWDKAIMLEMLKPTLHMSGATLLGALTVQMDKIILSGMVSVEKFGYYAIASTISTGVLQLLYPIVNAAIPHAVKFKDDAVALKAFNVKYAKLVLIALFFSALAFYFLGSPILNFWLKNQHVVTQVYSLLCILLIGTSLNALYTVGYINWIIKAKSLNILKVNFISLIVSILTIPILIANFGLSGACFGWIVINLVGFLMSTEWIIA